MLRRIMLGRKERSKCFRGRQEERQGAPCWLYKPWISEILSPCDPAPSDHLNTHPILFLSIFIYIVIKLSFTKVNLQTIV